MKNSIRYLIFSLALILPLSLILDSFADNDRNRKRYRHRGGYQKVDDDYQKHFKPVSNSTYRQKCGECHFAYQPELLPTASWLKILDQLDDHFGEGLDIDPDTRKNISEYLQTNAAEKSSAKHSVKIIRCLAGLAPIRITDIPYIRKEHHELDSVIFKRKSIGSLANCTACHTNAENGIYDDDDVKIPE